MRLPFFGDIEPCDLRDIWFAIQVVPLSLDALERLCRGEIPSVEAFASIGKTGSHETRPEEIREHTERDLAPLALVLDAELFPKRPYHGPQTEVILGALFEEFSFQPGYVEGFQNSTPRT